MVPNKPVSFNGTIIVLPRNSWWLISHIAMSCRLLPVDHRREELTDLASDLLELLLVLSESKLLQLEPFSKTSSLNWHDRHLLVRHLWDGNFSQVKQVLGGLLLSWTLRTTNLVHSL